MAKRGLRIAFWMLTGMLLILAIDMLLPRPPFQFLGTFGFQRGPASSHSFDVASYRVQADWPAVVQSARSELKARGFHEIQGDDRLAFQRGTGSDEIKVYIARDVKTAESSRRYLVGGAPGWTAVFVKGMDQRPLVVKLMDLFVR